MSRIVQSSGSAFSIGAKKASLIKETFKCGMSLCFLKARGGMPLLSVASLGVNSGCAINRLDQNRIYFSQNDVKGKEENRFSVVDISRSSVNKQGFGSSANVASKFAGALYCSGVCTGVRLIFNTIYTVMFSAF